MIWVGVAAPAALVLALAAFLPPRLWPDERRLAGTGRIVAAGVLAALAALPAAFYVYAVDVSAGLCGGTRGWAAILSVAVPLVVVGSWGLGGRNRVLLAWPAAVLAAAACSTIARYVDPRAHGYCETLSPYPRSVPERLAYSPTSSEISSDPCRNVTRSQFPQGLSTRTRQPPSSWR